MTEQATASQTPLLTVDETAERLSVSREYIYQLIRRGELACIELPLREGAKWSGKRIEPAELEAFIERNRVQSSP
jgi:excisionase family DNA binding protein